MEMNIALDRFDALSQETRLSAFLRLVRAGDSGLPAGALADALDIPHNTLSFHLRHLAEAGLVRARKDGRSIIYSADFGAMRDLIAYLIEDCCSDEVARVRRTAANGDLVVHLASCCQPAAARRQPRST